MPTVPGISGSSGSSGKFMALTCSDTPLAKWHCGMPQWQHCGMPQCSWTSPC
jgi:hypothetical protein